MILWVDEILHHPRIPKIMIPPTSNGFPWFQNGAGCCPGMPRNRLPPINSRMFFVRRSRQLDRHSQHALGYGIARIRARTLWAGGWHKANSICPVRALWRLGAFGVFCPERKKGHPFGEVAFWSKGTTDRHPPRNVDRFLGVWMGKSRYGVLALTNVF